MEDDIRLRLSYDPLTGAITRLVDAMNGRKAGDTATSRQAGGYLTVSVGSRNLFAHRVAWLLAQGEWPQQIDHINGDRKKNRLCNLRNVTNRVNSQNRKRA